MRSVTLPNEVMLQEVAKMLSEGNKVTIRARGNSMLPFIIGGKDSVVLEKKEEYVVGDIVLAEINPKLFVLHRFLKLDGDQIILMGDGNLSDVEKCPKDKILGHVVTIIHRGKPIDCSKEKERQKARVWNALLPVRRYLLAIYRRII